MPVYPGALTSRFHQQPSCECNRLIAEATSDAILACRPSPDAISYCESLRRLSCIEHPHGYPGNPQLISRRYVLTSAQNVKSMSGCLCIRREFCKTEWFAAAGRIELERRVSRSGRGSTKKKRRSAECFTKQKCWAGAKRSNTTLLTIKPSLPGNQPLRASQPMVPRSPAIFARAG